jgi:hypothetical protein
MSRRRSRIGHVSAPPGAIAPSQEKEELGKLLGRECRCDLARCLAFGDACSERGAPFGEDLGKPRAQHLASRRGLEAEIADQTAAAELGPARLGGISTS